MIFEDYNPNTPICAAWLNQVDRTVFTALGSSNTPAEVRSFLALIGEAPLDGTTYGRKSGQWVALIGGGTPGDAVLLSPSSALYNTVLLASQSYVGLILKGADPAATTPPYHAENYFEIRDRLDGMKLFIDEFGALTVGQDYTTNASEPTPTPGVTLLHTGVVSLVGQTTRAREVSSYGLLRVQPDANTHGVVVKLDASPVQNAFEVINSDNTRVSFIDKDGNVYAGAGASTGWAGLVGGGNSNIQVARGGQGTYPQLLLEADNYNRRLIYNPADSNISGNMNFELRKNVNSITTSLVQLRSINFGAVDTGSIGFGWRDSTNTQKGWFSATVQAVTPKTVISFGLNNTNELQPGNSLMTLKAQETNWYAHVHAARFEAEDTNVGYAQFWAYTTSGGANAHHFFGSTSTYPSGTFNVYKDGNVWTRSYYYYGANFDPVLLAAMTAFNQRAVLAPRSPSITDAEINKLRVSVLPAAARAGDTFDGNPGETVLTITEAPGVKSVVFSDRALVNTVQDQVHTENVRVVNLCSLQALLVAEVQELSDRLAALEAA